MQISKKYLENNFAHCILKLNGHLLSLDEPLMLLRECAIFPVSNTASIPPMDQAHFVAMCKSFYDLFIGQTNEQDLFHSVVQAGKILIKLGDIRTGFNPDENVPPKKTGAILPLAPDTSVAEDDQKDSISSSTRTLKGSGCGDDAKPTVSAPKTLYIPSASQCRDATGNSGDYQKVTT